MVKTAENVAINSGDVLNSSLDIALGVNYRTNKILHLFFLS